MGFGIEKEMSSSMKISVYPVRLFLAEYVATMVMVSIGCGSLAQAILSGGNSGNIVTITIAFGLAYTFGIYIAGGVSGGHMNPAVTLAFCILGRTRWVFFFLYLFAQMLGAFTGAALVYGMYIDAFNALEVEKSIRTARIFASYPQSFLTVGNAVLDQLYSTALLVMLWIAVTDKKNMGCSKGLIPIAVGLVVMAIGMAFGFNCMYPINPARDLAPRLFSLFADWPEEVFDWPDRLDNDNWWWIPLVIPMIGGAIGALMYMLFVGAHIPNDDDDDYSDPGMLRRSTKNGPTFLDPQDNDSLRRTHASPREPTRREDIYGGTSSYSNGYNDTRPSQLPRPNYKNAGYEPEERPTLYYGERNDRF